MLPASRRRLRLALKFLFNFVLNGVAVPEVWVTSRQSRELIRLP